jgi:hypothetical protein
VASVIRPSTRPSNTLPSELATNVGKAIQPENMPVMAAATARR